MGWEAEGWQMHEKLERKVMALTAEVDRLIAEKNDLLDRYEAKKEGDDTTAS